MSQTTAHGALRALAIFAEAQDPEALTVARDACHALGQQHVEAGLTGFLLVRKEELFGFLEAPPEVIDRLVQGIEATPELELLRTFELGTLSTPLCEGWEMRTVAGQHLTQVGLDVGLRQVLLARLQPHQDERKREQLLRIIRALLDRWQLADSGVECP